MRLDIAVSTTLILGALFGGAGAQPAPALFPITVNDKHGMIDRDGKVVIPPEYAEPVIFRDGLARVARGSKIAYLDATGSFVISPRFADAKPFSEGLAQVSVADPWGEVKYGYADKSGRLVVLARTPRPCRSARGSDGSRWTDARG